MTNLSENLILDTLKEVQDPSQSKDIVTLGLICLLYTSPSPRDRLLSRMPSSA